jgi:hypothetical protein
VRNQNSMYFIGAPALTSGSRHFFIWKCSVRLALLSPLFSGKLSCLRRVGPPKSGKLTQSPEVVTQQSAARLDVGNKTRICGEGPPWGKSNFRLDDAGLLGLACVRSAVRWVVAVSLINGSTSCICEADLCHSSPSNRSRRIQP